MNYLEVIDHVEDMICHEYLVENGETNGLSLSFLTGIEQQNAKERLDIGRQFFGNDAILLSSEALRGHLRARWFISQHPAAADRQPVGGDQEAG
jgi:hypothetical protein